MTIRGLLGTALVGMLALVACSSAHATHVVSRGSPTSATCSPPVGGRCAGPEAVRDSLVSDLLLSADGRTVHGLFQCGGRLQAAERPDGVVLTYVASHVRAGGLTCALVPVSVRLHRPLGSRVIVDGVSGARLHIGTRAGPLLR